jgi:hypothetical protein
MLIVAEISKHIRSLIIPAALALIVVGCLGISAVFVLASLFILPMCHSAWGIGADRREQPIDFSKAGGSAFGAYTHGARFRVQRHLFSMR